MSSNLKNQFDRLLGLILPAALTSLSSAATATEIHSHQDVFAIGNGSDAIILSDPLNRDSSNLFAGHRSHSSHSSHSSSRGGGYSYYPPDPPPTPAPEPEPAPRQATPPASSGFYSAPESARALPSSRYEPAPPAAITSETGGSKSIRRSVAAPNDLKVLIMRVQVGLIQRGYDVGAVDGEMSTDTSLSLKMFQAASSLKITGTMTTETLNALGIKL